MTALQLNSEFFAVMSQIAARKGLLQQVLDFAKSLLAEKKDETLMSKEEFFSKIEKAEDDYRQGKCARLQDGETVTDLLRRNGYDI